MKESLFSDADTIIEDINKVCSWASYERNMVYNKFKDNVCGMLLTKESHGTTFDDLNKWIDATEFICPKTKPHCDKLRKLLGAGAGIKCGGS